MPQIVLTEVVYCLKREIGTRGAIEFLEEFSASEPYLQEITVANLKRTKEIMHVYADANLDFADSCIIALAERLKITQVGTLDRRDFTVVRPSHVQYLTVLP